MSHYFTLYIHNQMTEVTQLIGHLNIASNVAQINVPCYFLSNEIIP
jgi:hypothetical protein